MAAENLTVGEWQNGDGTAPFVVVRSLSIAFAARWLANWTLLSLGLATVLLGGRRWSGAMDEPLPVIALLALAAGLAAVTAGCRIAWRSTSREEHLRRGVFLRQVLASLNLLVLGWAISLPGSSPVSLLTFWSVLAAEEAAFAIGAMRSRRAAGAATAGEIPAAPPAASSAAAAPSAALAGHQLAIFAAEDEDELEVEPELPPDVMQQVTWARDEHGGMAIHGVIRAEFSVGQRQRIVHLAFCPPLDRPPQFTVDLRDGPAADLRAIQIETFGAAIEIRLLEPCAVATMVEVHFLALENEGG